MQNKKASVSTIPIPTFQSRVEALRVFFLHSCHHWLPSTVRPNIYCGEKAKRFCTSLHVLVRQPSVMLQQLLAAAAWLSSIGLKQPGAVVVIRANYLMMACAERTPEGAGRPHSAPEVGQGVWLGENGQPSQGPGKGLCLFG